MALLSQTFSIVLLVLGFGFVVFFHELGHFIAAKWVGIKVEQFAVGFGQAMFSWRKGLGFRLGGSNKEYQARLKDYLRNHRDEQLRSRNEDPDQFTESQLAKASQALGLGETEYRINWIPLGGYVKMLGQDDMNPNATSDDPRSYNRKSVPKRMIVVSAGVIMNVILAAIGFMALFLIGFRAPPPVVGLVMPGSPAQAAGIQVGDRIETLDGRWQHDFTKITLNTALAKEGQPLPVVVRHPDGTQDQLTVVPARGDNDSKFLMLGVVQSTSLRGPDPAVVDDTPANLVDPQQLLIRPGDVITQINGEHVKPEQYYKLDAALQAGRGQPVKLTVADKNGQTRSAEVMPHFAMPFGETPLNFMGMVPRATVSGVRPDSPARDKVLPGDVIVSVVSGKDRIDQPASEQLIKTLGAAGKNGTPVTLTVHRDGKELTLPPMVPSLRVAKDQYGLGLSLMPDDRHAVVAGTLDDSPAQKAGIAKGAEITQVAGKPVTTWFDVRNALENLRPGDEVAVTAQTAEGTKQYTLSATEPALAAVHNARYMPLLQLHELVEKRHTDNPFIAAAWGVGETRDFILQFYVTLQRMFQGSVSYKNMMGPLGIVTAGAHFAFKGTDWLIWFLAMISANLAVVNFLPIPIVDGGLFVFLILEKLKGKPLSQRTQSIAQMVGLAVILSVFLLVTYQDILRLVR